MLRKSYLICFLIAVAAAAAGIKIAAPSVTAAQSPGTSSACLDYDPDLSGFTLNPVIPHDAYAANSPACADSNSPKPPQSNSDRINLRRVYDIFSWESFLAINWPIDENGQPRTNLTNGECLPAWITWAETYAVFKEDGTEPDVVFTSTIRSTLPPISPTLTLTTTAASDKKTRLLYTVKQANSNLPLWDQNGNMVYYEILLNDEAFNNIKDYQLYNQQGQLDYYRTVEKFEFTWGSLTQDETGAIQLKLAWKILDKDDIPSRFCAMDAYVLVPQENKDGWEWQQKKVGLVGMHIAHKTASSRNWVWSTFEQVDNIQVDDTEVLAYAAQGQTLKPSFNNPECAVCPVNLEPVADENGLLRTQVARMTPIPKATGELNRQVQAMLKAQGSVWQYYELVGVQYVTDPNNEPDPHNQEFPENITNVSGGKPDPVFLVNSVIETYDQKGNQKAEEFIGRASDDAGRIVFGTQSCIGCHYSAGLVVAEAGDRVFRLPGTANFSFQLEKAQPMSVLLSVDYDPVIENELNQQTLPATFNEEFWKRGLPTSGASVAVEPAAVGEGLDLIVEDKWLITINRPDSEEKYVVQQEEDEFIIYILKK